MRTEIEQLSTELRGLSAQAAMRLGALSDTMLEYMHTQWLMSALSVTATAAHPYAGFGVTAYRVGSGMLSLYDFHKEAMEGSAFDYGFAFYNIKGDVNWLLPIEVFVGSESPAKDIRQVTELVRAIRSNQALKAYAALVGLGSSLAQYGDFDAEFGARGTLITDSSATSAGARAWFRTRGGACMYGVEGSITNLTPRS